MSQFIVLDMLATIAVHSASNSETLSY